MAALTKNKIFAGILLAVAATFIWSGNFIVARGVYKEIPPVSLAFYRWLTASVVIAPFAWRSFKAEKQIVLSQWKYFFWAGLTGVSLFNTFVYIAGRYSSAINLALIGTTTSPVFSIVLARVFLKERISVLRITGLLICIMGILLLLSRGNLSNLSTFTFSNGDAWILTGAFAFAVYNVLAKRRPSNISPLNFLFVAFAGGTLLLFPFYLWEMLHTSPVEWGMRLVLVILYLGIGASVISFMLWNGAIARLGAARASLFGNLIPVFSTIEAVILLNEKISAFHYISFILVLSGLVVANLFNSKFK